MKRRITRDDILDNDAYLAVRAERRKEIVNLKRGRRLAVGPYAMVYFENYDTMWHQIQEMLLIENGGAEQIEGELQAYNPLIPQGADLRVTLMFEIEDPVRRKRLLSQWQGIEKTISLRLGCDISLDATTIDGEDPPGQMPGGPSPGLRTASVHFLKFTFTPDQIAVFKRRDVPVSFCIDHPSYAHRAQLPPSMHRALMDDFL